MDYNFEQNESIEAGLRRIGYEQVTGALAELENIDLDHHEVIHRIRTRCKKMRGLLRLVRPSFPQFQQENQFFRDLGRTLSYARDSHVILASFDMLSSRCESPLNQETNRLIRAELTRLSESATGDSVALKKTLETVQLNMEAVKTRIASWEITTDGFAAIAGGLLKTYRRGGKALENAYENPSSDTFHEWRKQVKYHWYHLRLLSLVWPAMLNVHCSLAAEISSLLGDEHDLAVLGERVAHHADCFASQSEPQALSAMIEQLRTHLRAQAHPSGARLYAEKPADLVARLGRYFHIWNAQ